jgi:hypothetical protein
MFSAVGNQTIYLRLTSTLSSQTSQKTIQVLDVAAQKLFSTDTDLVADEPDIMKWLPKTWSSWNLVHLKSQEYILNLLSEKRILSELGIAYTKDDIQNKAEVRDWSVALTLHYIFKGLSNAEDDVFKVKATDYFNVAQERASTARLSLDYNKNAVDDDEDTDMRSIELRRA